MANIDRNAWHGRNWEGFGSDPYLSGENAFFNVQGIQDQGVVATAKHYICNE
jgi:beta-glucosidase